MDRRPHPDDTTQTGRPPGAVRRDSQGNAVWQWAAATGRQALDSTSRLLRKLEVPGLTLLDDEGASSSGGASKGSGGAPAGRASKSAGRDASGGYDPYGGRGASVAAKAAPKAAASKGTTPKGGPSKAFQSVKAKPSLLARLFGRR